MTSKKIRNKKEVIKVNGEELGQVEFKMEGGEELKKMFPEFGTTIDEIEKLGKENIKTNKYEC